MFSLILGAILGVTGIVAAVRTKSQAKKYISGLSKESQELRK